MRLGCKDIGTQLGVIEGDVTAALGVTDAGDLAALGIDLDAAIGRRDVHLSAERTDAGAEVRAEEELHAAVGDLDRAGALVEDADADDLVAAAVEAQVGEALDVDIAGERAHADGRDAVRLDLDLAALIGVDERIAVRAADAEGVRRADIDIDLAGLEADLGIVRVGAAAEGDAAVTVADQLRAAGGFEGDAAVAVVAVTADAVAELRVAVDLQAALRSYWSG